MRISISKKSPSATDLPEVLKREFSGQYGYKLFGLGKIPTIMVSKSNFIGAQITVRENEIDIQSTAPSLLMAYILTIMEILGLIAFFPLWIVHLRKQGRALEQELATFFNQKYS
jgi:hypothetical protein